MDRRDQELLNKQFRWLRHSPQNDGVMVVAFATAFVAGMVLGSAIFGAQIDRDGAFAGISPIANVSQRFATLPAFQSDKSGTQVVLRSFQ